MAVGHDQEDETKHDQRFAGAKADDDETSGHELQDGNRKAEGPEQSFRDPGFGVGLEKEPLGVADGRELETLPPSRHEEENPDDSPGEETSPPSIGHDVSSRGQHYKEPSK